MTKTTPYGPGDEETWGPCTGHPNDPRTDPEEAFEDHSVTLCARCGDEAEVFVSNCFHKPEKLLNAPIGMYHCPDCGAMVLGGIEHGWLCRRCLDRKHPAYDAL